MTRTSYAGYRFPLEIIQHAIWLYYGSQPICANAGRSPHATWHLDEVCLKINGRMVYLWRAVDYEGEALDVLIQSRRNKRAARRLCASF